MTEKQTNETKVYVKSASYLQDRELVVRTSTRSRHSVSFSPYPEPGNEPEHKYKHENEPKTYPHREENSSKQFKTGRQPKALITDPNYNASENNVQKALMYSGGARKQIPSRKKSQKKKRSRKSKKN